MVSFLISSAIMLGVAIVVMGAWFLLVFFVLRLAGIQFPMLPRKSQARKNLRELAKSWRVFLSGVVLFGWSVAMSHTAFYYLQSRYFGHALRKSLISDLIESMIVFSAIGISIELKKQKNTVPHSPDPSPTA